VVHLPEVVLCTRLDGAPAASACVAAGHAGAASRSPRLLLTVVVTLGCLRVNEVARLQVCYLWFDYLMSDGVPGFEGTCGATQPAEERHAAQGPLPTFGRSRDPELDVAAQLRRWLELAGLEVHPSCAGEGTAAGRARMPPPAVTRQKASDRCCLAVMHAASGGRFFALLMHLGASRSHLDRDRGPRGRGEFVPAEWQRRRDSGAGVHADRVPCSLSRDIRGLWPVTGGRVNLAVPFFRF
jgi:hypothetical protein